MTRIVEPELLDALPPEDADAERSRIDLRWINAWMGHRPILERTLESLPTQNVRRLVELGAGDGTLALALATSLHTRWPDVEILLVDRLSLVTDETVEKFRLLGWRARPLQADVLVPDILERLEADVVLVNLFLHHFEETALRRILGWAASRSQCFVALEPRRSRVVRMSCELLWLIGCNRVTRHDARISVRAGFQNRELSQLWSQTPDWSLCERSAGLFSHLFIAGRTGP
jgi:hypothetical protein